MQAPLPHVAAAPVAPRRVLASDAPPSHAKPRTATAIIGVVLALVAVGIVAALVVTSNEKKHKPTVVIDASAATTPTVTATTEEPPPADTPIMPAPTLKPWMLPDGGLPEPCGAYRRVRDRGDASADLLDRLDKRCRASGGVP
jgi:hypothetical protein